MVPPPPGFFASLWILWALVAGSPPDLPLWRSAHKSEQISILITKTVSPRTTWKKLLHPCLNLYLLWLCASSLRSSLFLATSWGSPWAATYRAPLASRCSPDQVGEIDILKNCTLYISVGFKVEQAQTNIMVITSTELCSRPSRITHPLTLRSIYEARQFPKRRLAHSTSTEHWKCPSLRLGLYIHCLHWISCQGQWHKLF